jgi:hypothetical protein
MLTDKAGAAGDKNFHSFSPTPDLCETSDLLSDARALSHVPHPGQKYSVDGYRA